MKKILILSYFFPPCNLTASQRIESFAKHLNKFGLFPIIITRKWERHIGSIDDTYYSTSDGVKVEKKETYEVHYLPYKSTLRDKLHISRKYKIIKILLSGAEILLQNIFIRFCAFSNFYSYSKNILKSDSSIKAIISSGNPFILFKIGSLLSKGRNTPWIADYRDAWTSSTIDGIGRGGWHNILNKYQSYFEKKWVKTASYITATSEPIGYGITKLTGIQNISIYNGYEPEDFVQYSNIKPNSDIFQITYVGTLYPGQQIEFFLTSFKNLIDSNPEIKIKLLFLGLAYNTEQKVRVDKCLNGYEKYYEITERITKNKVLEAEKKSHLLLHIAWHEHSGIIASKIYEYLGAKTKILVTPGDNGSIDRIIKESNAGKITYTIDETFVFLQQEYNSFLTNKSDTYSNLDTTQFTRENQTKKLAQIIHQIIVEDNKFHTH